MAKSGTAAILERSKLGPTYSFIAADVVVEKYFLGGGGGSGLTYETAALSYLLPYYSKNF
jgi:hypothetical protein